MNEDIRKNAEINDEELDNVAGGVAVRNVATVAANVAAVNVAAVNVAAVNVAAANVAAVDVAAVASSVMKAGNNN